MILPLLLFLSAAADSATPDSPSAGIRLIPSGLPWARGPEEARARLASPALDCLVVLPFAPAPVPGLEAPWAAPSFATTTGPDPFAPARFRWNGDLSGEVIPRPRLGDARLPALVDAALGAAFVYSIVQTAPKPKAKPNKPW